MFEIEKCLLCLWIVGIVVIDVVDDEGALRWSNETFISFSACHFWILKLDSFNDVVEQPVSCDICNQDCDQPRYHACHIHLQPTIPHNWPSPNPGPRPWLTSDRFFVTITKLLPDSCNDLCAAIMRLVALTLNFKPQPSEQVTWLNQIYETMTCGYLRRIICHCGLQGGYTVYGKELLIGTKEKAVGDDRILATHRVICCKAHECIYVCLIWLLIIFVSFNALAATLFCAILSTTMLTCSTFTLCFSLSPCHL